MLFVPHQPFCHLELHRNKEYRQHHWKLLHGYIVYLDKKQLGWLFHICYQSWKVRYGTLGDSYTCLTSWTIK
jgi:hypothetical protein